MASVCVVAVYVPHWNWSYYCDPAFDVSSSMAADYAEISYCHVAVSDAVTVVMYERNLCVLASRLSAFSPLDVEPSSLDSLLRLHSVKCVFAAAADVDVPCSPVRPRTDRQ